MSPPTWPLTSGSFSSCSSEEEEEDEEEEVREEGVGEGAAREVLHVPLLVASGAKAPLEMSTNMSATRRIGAASSSRL